MKYKVNFDLEFKKNPFKGLYIALEGIDGSGKTTQAEQLAEYFKKQGREVVVTHEPSRDGEVGRLIHNVLQQNMSVSKVAIQYLFSADRAEHQGSFIVPSLESGKVVISDRCFWSSIAYGILDKNGIQNTHNTKDQLLVSLSILSFYHQFISPNAVFYLNVSVESAAKRLAQLKRKAELYEKAELLNRAKEVYDWMAKEFPAEFITIDGEQKIEEVTNQIIENVKTID